MKGPIKRLLLSAISILFLVSKVSFGQDIATEDYVKLIRITDPQEKIDSLQTFRMKFPSSRYYMHSLTQTFSAYVELGNADSAIAYATETFSKMPEAARESYYNNFAYQLSQKKIGLDSALSYIDKAVASAKAKNSSYLGMYLDTQASVLYAQGKAKEAIAVQQEAIKEHEGDADYVTNLATYLNAAGDQMEALKTISKAVLLGKSEKASSLFDEWMKKAYPDAGKRKKAKTDVVNQVVDDYLKSDNSLKAKSTAAAYLGMLKLDLDKAKSYAEEAVKSINDATSVDDQILYLTNLGEVEYATGSNKDALKTLMKIEPLTAPWDVDFWYLHGELNEALGQKEKALNSYLITTFFYNDSKYVNAVKRVADELGLDKDATDKRIEKIKEKMKDFEPGKFVKTSNTGKVVVAELFTGAECPPCVAADLALDKLSEYYPKNDAVILEYHVHIPGPDPMTNPNSFSKYKFYGGNFGTPTIFFDGTENIIGGGPDYVAQNRANVYKLSFARHEKEEPGAKISGSADLKNDKVNVNINIEPENKSDLTNCQIQVALLEKSIAYTGRNGISKHIYVVRDLVNGADGIKVNLENGKQNVSETIDVAKVEQGIKTYLDDPTKYPSWRAGTSFSGWKARPDMINRSNLAVVVYVQNSDSHKILQAKYFDLNPKTDIGMNK